MRLRAAWGLAEGDAQNANRDFPERVATRGQAVVAEALAMLAAATEPLQVKRLACSEREAAGLLGV